MADDENDDSNARNRRGNRNAGGDGAKKTTEKKPPPKPVGTMGQGEPQIVDGTRSLRVHAQFLRGTEALIGKVTFRKDGVPVDSSAVPTDRGGSAAYILTGLPLAACSFTVTAELDDPFTAASPLAVVLPKAEKKDPTKIGAVEFLDVERQPSSGRNIIPVLVYDEDGKVMPKVVVWVIDAACMSDPLLPPKNSKDIHKTDDEGRVAIDYTILATEKVRDVMVVVPRKPGAFRRYVLRGPDPVSLKPLPLPKRRPGESNEELRQRRIDAGKGVVS